MVPIAVPIVQDKTWVPIMQQVGWDMVVVQGMIVVVVWSLEGFVDIVACFVVPLVTTKLGWFLQLRLYVLE